MRLTAIAGLLVLSMAPWAVSISAQEPEAIEPGPMPHGSAERGRLIFAQCRTCHYAEKFMGHNNGPNLHRIFGKVAGKQPGFEYYSETLSAAEFVWTPELMYAWLENPARMFPDSSMMSRGVPDAQQRADLIAFLQLASVRGGADSTTEDNPQ